VRVKACARAETRDAALLKEQMPPRQKPNEACACGSGAKFKKCCGTATAAAAAAEASPAPRAAAPRPPGAMSPAERMKAWSAIKRFDEEAGAADEAGDLARATRRCVSGLALLGDAFCDGANEVSIVERVVRLLFKLISLYSRLGDLAASEDCHARALRLIALPPEPFWARALLTPSFAAWRDDQPLSPGDVRCLVTLDVALGLNPDVLHRLHTNMGLAFSRAGGHATQAIASYEAGLQGLFARCPAGPDRDAEEAGLYQNTGNQHMHLGDLAAARACYDTAARLLSGSGGGAEVALRRRTLLAQLTMNRASMEAKCRPGVSTGHATDEDMASFEQAWAHCSEHREGGLARQWADADGTPSGVCRAALGRCSTAMQRRTWLLRAFTLPGPQQAARAAAARACRSCFAPPAAGDKLRRCAACGRVSYCGEECQRADCARHKPRCAEETPEAAVADAACIACGKPALDADDDARCSSADAHASLTGDTQVFLLRCGHLAHARCVAWVGTAPCPACNAGPGMNTFAEPQI
jgi:tetratricopeptide (TPR) repeat protein